MTAVSSALAARLRHCAYLGARFGPEWWLRYSPTPIGALAFAVAGGRRAALKRRLEWVLGQPPSTWQTLRSFVNFAHCLAETLAWEARKADLEGEGFEVLQNTTHRGGVILLTAHTGAWELLAAELATRMKKPVVLVMQAESSAGARRVHERVRGHSGVRTAYTGENAFIGLSLKAELAQGHILAFQIDRPAVSGRSVSTQLFGRAFPFPEGPLRLARVSGVPLVPVFGSRRGFLQHHIRVFPPTFVPRTARAVELAAVAQEVVTNFETFVAQVPEQWFDFGSLEVEIDPSFSGTRQ